MEKLTTFIQFCFNVLFHRADSSRAKWAVGILLAGLFVGGLLHWGFFLDWTNNRFDIQDWHVQVKPSLDFLSESLHSGQFPMYAESEYMKPSAYLARPLRPFSPQILLLYFLDPATYVLVNIWIFYSISFLGLLYIRKRYQLSFISFLVLFLLFYLNGHISAHIGAGHMEWMGYFLLPFFVLLTLKMIEGEKTNWAWMLAMSLVMLIINLQGGAHFFIYCMAFLLLLGLFQIKYFSVVIKSILFSGLVSMIRILPASHYAKGTTFENLGGFDSVLQAIQIFVVPSSRGYWELTYYVGLLGFVLLFYFGIIKTWARAEKYRSLYLPALAMTFFSIGAIYAPLFNSGIPFLDSQRAPTRFLIVPVIFLIVLATIQFQSMINEWNRKNWQNEMITLFGIGLMAYDLLLNTRVWSLGNYGISKRATDIIEVAVGNYPDPTYMTTLIIGFTCTVITLVALVFLAIRERNQSV